MTLEQDIEFLKMMTFDSIDEMNNNAIIQKYFDVKTDGKGAIEHIFKGFIDSMNYLDGYHSECLYPNLYGIGEHKNIIKNEPYKLRLNAKKLDPSTFFPITMSSSNVLVAILLAYKKIENKVTSVIYLDEYNFKIKVCISYNGKIFNAYPDI